MHKGYLKTILIEITIGIVGVLE